MSEYSYFFKKSAKARESGSADYASIYADGAVSTTMSAPLKRKKSWLQKLCFRLKLFACAREDYIRRENDQ